MKVFSSRESRWKAVLFVLLVAGVLAGMYLFLRQYAAFVFNASEFRVWLDQFGILAPLVFILIQTVQVVVAPIPGQVVALAAGYLFGPLAGTVYSLVGVLLGSAIAFTLAKRYGREFVENLLHEDVMVRFDGFVDTIGVPGLVAFVIVPGLPDDAICFLAGLTKWKLRTFMVAITIGRLPAYVLTVYAGGELASGRFLQGMLLIGSVIVFSIVGYSKQETIRDWAQRLEARSPL